MTAQLVTCVAEGQYRTESIFENAGAHDAQRTAARVSSSSERLSPMKQITPPELAEWLQGRGPHSPRPA
jgi:hypothetical protein